jgi:hypothetical protein
MNAIRAHQDVTRHLNQGLVAAAEACDDSGRRFFEAFKPMPFAHRASARAVANSCKHDAVQHAAVYGELRQIVAGIAPAHFGNNVLTELVDVAKLSRFDADCLYGVPYLKDEELRRRIVGYKPMSEEEWGRLWPSFLPDRK